MIRDGKMLLEDCPSKILKSFNVNSLEDVHLQLSAKQNQEKEKEKYEFPIDTIVKRKNPIIQKSFKIRNIKALMIKNFIQMNGM